MEKWRKNCYLDKNTMWKNGKGGVRGEGSRVEYWEVATTKVVKVESVEVNGGWKGKPRVKGESGVKAGEWMVYS